MRRGGAIKQYYTDVVDSFAYINSFTLLTY